MGKIILGWIPVEFWHHLVSQNLKTLIFSIFHFGRWGPRKVDDLVTSPINQFWDYFIRNRIEKLVPVNYQFPTGNKKHLKTSTKPFSNLDFWQKSGFPKIRDLSLVAPRGVYISRNDPPNKKSGNARKHKKTLHLLTKWLPFLSPPPHSDSHPCMGLQFTKCMHRCIPYTPRRS